MKLSVFLLLVASCFGCLSRHPEPKSHDYIDDKVTAARVLQLLHGQPAYKYPDIHVVVTNGAVYLTGSVQTSDQKLKATELAQHADDVHTVKNDLAIKQSH